jgi:pimeloyl-ACP methyl ester carboxylesterase
MKCVVHEHLTIEYAEAGHGRPLVLLHAFPLSHAMWQPQLEGLHDFCRILTPDLRGFGGTSPFTDAPSMDQMADDIAAFLEVLDIREPIVLGGLSMGGYVALAFARRHPRRLASLILADTRAEADGPEAKANRETAIASAQADPPSAFIEAMLPRLVAESTLKDRPGVADLIRSLGSAQKSEAIVAALRALRDRPDATPGLADITVPTLVIVGALDTLTPPSAAATLASTIRYGKLVHIADAGHLSNLEQPAAFNNAVRTFQFSKAYCPIPTSS